MGQPVLSAIITADGRKFTKTVAELEAQLKRFQAGLKNTSNPESIARLNRAIGETQKQIGVLKNIGDPLKPLKNGVGGATLQLGGLGKALKGSLVGLGGITKTATKAFLGPAGIGYAIGLVTTKLVLLGEKFFSVSQSSKALDEALGEQAKTIADEVVKLTTLVGLVNNVNTSNEDRSKGLKAINQEYGKYLKNLGIEEVNLGTINQAYEKIIDNLLRQAVIKGLQEEISAAVEGTAKSLLKLEVEEEKRRQKSKPAITADQKRAQELKDLNQQLQSNQRATSDGFIAQQRSNQVYDAGVNKLATYDERLKLLKDALTRQLTPLLNVTTKFEDLGITLDKTSDKTENIIDKAKKLADFFNKTTIRDISFDVDPTLSTKENEQRARDFIEKVLDPIRRTDFQVKPEIRVRPVFTLDLQRVQLFQNRSQPAKEATKTFDQVEKEFVDQLNRLGANNRFVLKLNADVKIGEDFEKKLKEAAERINTAANDFFQNALSSIGEGIGNVLSGKNFGSEIIDVLAGFLEQIGKALIEYGTIKLGIEKLLQSLNISGVAAIGLGIAAIALSKVLKLGAKNVSGFRAAGGPVSGGRSYVVGEKGPEIFVPNTGGNIIPNNRIGAGAMAAMNAQPVHVTGDFRIEGQTLVAFISNIMRSQGRTT